LVKRDVHEGRAEKKGGGPKQERKHNELTGCGSRGTEKATSGGLTQIRRGGANSQKLCGEGEEERNSSEGAFLKLDLKKLKIKTRAAWNVYKGEKVLKRERGGKGNREKNRATGGILRSRESAT